jgi:dihydroorotate dehydrogenase
VFLKVAPDIAEASVPGVVATVRANGMDGVIVSNTTITRPEGLRSAHRGEAGGLSGAPLLSLSTRMLARFHEADPALPLIGVGGIASGADAYAKIRAGASAVQLYSAMVFEGAGLIPRIKAELAARLTADGFRSVAEACGA